MGHSFWCGQPYEAKFEEAEMRKYLGLKVLNGNTFEDICT